MEDMSIALSCMRSEAGNIAGNLDSMLRKIEEAKMLGADMIVFPELSLTGYAVSSGKIVETGEYSSEFRRLVAASMDICICFGYVDYEGHIVQAIAERGKIVGEYWKTHLGDAESERIVPGDSLDVIYTKKAVFGIQLCWESHFPDITRTYAQNGADVVLMPTASSLPPQRRMDIWNRTLPARAYDNSVYVVAVNASGDNGCGVNFGGCAMVLDPFGKVIAQDSSGDEARLVTDLRKEPLELIREGDGYVTMRNVYYLDRRRPELYRE
ncbi:MAG: hypothetical protein IKP20_01040 [Candidatus Methanomethylophilaceae archaeon]|jgi:predicted amidohydrolase|nr:hypothetical protein [Candidatus Methanomethylophilaceae archaeon]